MVSALRNRQEVRETHSLQASEVLGSWLAQLADQQPVTIASAQFWFIWE